MSRIAIIEPKTLLGEAVRDGLAESSSTADEIELFTLDSEAVGAVSEVAGRAAIVQALEDDSLDTFDTALFCDQEIDLDTLRKVPDSCRSILIDPYLSIDDAVPLVAGVNSSDFADAARVVSPPPALLLLAHLLFPLRELGPLEIVAHVLQPASARGQAALDELFAQTRAILSMSDERPEELFGTQMAFNLLPWSVSTATLGRQLEAIVGNEVQAQILLSQAAVFHCCTAAVFLRPAAETELTRVQDLLRDQPLIEVAETPELLGPVTAAASDKILVGEITPNTRNGYWLWCCADNLTLSAANALALAKL